MVWLVVGGWQDTSGGLFDDMELIYNTSPSMAQLDPVLRHDDKLQVRGGRGAAMHTDTLYISPRLPCHHLSCSPSPPCIAEHVECALSVIRQHCFSGFPRIGIMRMPAVTDAPAPHHHAHEEEHEEKEVLSSSPSSSPTLLGSSPPPEKAAALSSPPPSSRHFLYIFGNFPVDGEASRGRRFTCSNTDSYVQTFE